MRFAAAIAVAALAAPAGAACVTGSHMDRGVEVAFADGDRATIQRRIDRSVRMDEVPGEGGPVVRSLLARGFWEFRSFELDPAGWPVEGSRLETLYPVAPGSLPQPVAGLSWRGEATPVFEGTALGPDGLEVEVTDGEPLVLGPCTYDALEVAVKVERGEEDPVALRYRYLPALGAALLVGRRAGDGPEEVREVTGLSPRR